MIRKIFLPLLFLLLVNAPLHAQIDLPSYPVKGIIRVNTEEIGYTNKSGIRKAISFRRFTVDSVSTEPQFFGWHYSELKPHIEDHEPSLKAFRTANVFVTSQQLCILGALTSTAIFAFTKTTAPQPVLTGAIIGFSSGILISHIGKRISINTSIRRHNKKLM